MKKIIPPITTVILILISVISILPAPEPNHCGICDSIPFHAPCLVNLATGEVGELEVYAPHPFKVAELNDYQPGGTFSLLYIAGLNGYRDTANWEIHITVPKNENEYKEKYFCKSCRNIIQNHSENGYLLLDMLTPECFTMLTLESDKAQTIRFYEVQTNVQSSEIEIIIYGKLNLVDGYIT